MIRLKLDPHIIHSLDGVAAATGLGQVAFTSLVGFAICLGLGLDILTSVYVAVALTVSSTIIIVKLLTDKREVDSLHGRIAIGFLIVQDIVVVVGDGSSLVVRARCRRHPGRIEHAGGVGQQFVTTDGTPPFHAIGG